MNRRSFFGFGAGAAIAGPSIAQDFAEKAGSSGIFSPTPTSDYYDKACTTQETMQSSSQNIRHIKERLNKLRQGQNDTLWKVRHRKAFLRKINADALKSISQSHKHHMLTNIDDAVEVENEIFDLEQRLINMKERFFDTFKIPFVE